MSSFKTVFGMAENDLRKTCLLLPFMNARLKDALEVSHQSRGSIYSAADNGLFTIATSPMGPAFCADAVLYLAAAGCRRLVFFGACGTRDERQAAIGDTVLAGRALSGEMFSDMLECRPPREDDAARADADLAARILALAARRDIALGRADCLTVGSLALEKDYIEGIKNRNFAVMDMETAAVYRAASARKLPACALLHVTDCPFSNPLEQVFAPENRGQVHESMARAGRDILALLSALEG